MNKKLETGQSTSYDFSIYGEGNISAITKPLVVKDGDFEFYEPNVKQNINHENNKVTGTKSFSYFLIPREPGTYNLGDHFSWVYFNPRKNRYDTLRSNTTVVVAGESMQNEAIQSTDHGTFYDRIAQTDNSLKPMSDTHWQKTAFIAFLLVMLSASLYLVVKK